MLYVYGGWEADKVNRLWLKWRAVAPAVLVGLLWLGWALPGQAGQPVMSGRIGVVDMQQILNTSERGRAAKQRLDQEREVRQKELDSRQQEVMKLQADLEKQAPVLSEQAKREKGEALQRKVRDIRRMAEDANRDFEKRLGETEADMTREIVKVVQEFGKDQGFTLILERSTLPYVASTVDITADVIKRFDGNGKPK
jgi:outer membrane protein